MTYFSPWFLLGFVLSAIVGVLVTDLRREEIRPEIFRPTQFILHPRPQVLAIVVGLWLVLLVAAIISSRTPDLLIGSVIGAAAAPWVWLHFVRSFGADAKLGEAEKEGRIKGAAYELWLKERKPEGRADEHWSAARKEVEDTEQRVIETSAGLELARYRLVSILLGVALLVVTLVPVLKEWLPRAQQFQAFGISLTLLATQPSNQDRRLVLPSGSHADQGGDRLSSATRLAHLIGAAAEPSVPTLDQIGPDLKGFPDLSIYEKDRAYIAWLTYELPGNAPLQPFLRKLVGLGLQRPDSLTLKDYISRAEDLLKTGYSPPRWVDTDLDREFVSYLTLVSSCFQNYISDIHDPQLFVFRVADSLRASLQPIFHGPQSDQMLIPSGFQVALTRALRSEENTKTCADEIAKLKPNWGPYFDPNGRFDLSGQLNSPYPSLISALYLAAIGDVNSGVLLMEDWINDFNRRPDRFNRRPDRFEPNNDPQLGWYLWRAKWGASALPYNYHGFVVPHRQLVRWQLDESKQLATMLRVEVPDGWERLCRRLVPSTLHDNLGRHLAFLYATERFYLFENLIPDDFRDEKEKIALKLGSLTDYLREAEVIRDHRGCLESIRDYQKYSQQYASYFRLYTAQLRLIELAIENRADRSKSLIETIGQELEDADHFGITAKEPTLLPTGDFWETHRDRLRLLHEQLEDVKRANNT